MDYILKKKTGIAFVLCFTLIVSTLTFMPFGTSVDAAPISEEAQLEQKTIEPEKGSTYEGYVVSIKDKQIDSVSQNESSDEFPSTESEKYYLVETTLEALTLASSSSIEFLEPNYLVYPMDTVYPPNDKNYQTAVSGSVAQKNSYEFMGIDALWKDGLSGKGVEVVVIDSGINSHSDMASPSKILHAPTDGVRYINGNVKTDKINNDVLGHGTQVTSLIKAKTNNGINISGIASNSNITSIRVFDKDSNGDVSGNNFQVLQAFDYLNQSGNTPDVINLSLGSGYPTTYEENAITSLISKGCIVIASNGNYGTSNDPDIGIFKANDISYPAGYDGVIGVGATKPTRPGYSDSNAIASFSSKNSSCDVSAWGYCVPVLSSSSKTNSTYNSGTSFSSPIVAGIAACLKENYPNLNASRFMDLITSTSTDVNNDGRDDSYGYGIINAEAMLNKLSHAISYDTKGGTFGEDDNYKTSYRVKPYEIPLPMNVTNGSLAFKGWYTDDLTPSGPYSAIPASTKKDLHFYAQWGNETTVSFDGGTGVTKPESTTYSFIDTYGELPEVSKTGYTFGGWYLDKAYKKPVTDTSTVGALDHTLYAKWTINSYKITLVLNGGSKVTKANVNYNSKIGTVPSPKRSGYTFMGWYRDSKYKTKLSSSYVVKGPVTLYAKWLSSNAKLKLIKPTTSKLSPKFSSTRASYKVTTSRYKSTVTLKATKTYSTQKIYMKIGWSGKYKLTNYMWVPLKRGQTKNVYMRVYAPDGKTYKNYVVTVKRNR